jgi:hypothetical protein
VLTPAFGGDSLCLPRPFFVPILAPAFFSLVLVDLGFSFFLDTRHIQLPFQKNFILRDSR